MLVFFLLFQDMVSLVLRGGGEERINNRAHPLEKERPIYRLRRKVGAFSFLSFPIVKPYPVFEVNIYRDHLEIE